MVSFLFIIVLYEINRECHDKRSLSQYQEWFSQTLTIHVPMIINTEEKNREINGRVQKIFQLKLSTQHWNKFIFITQFKM